MAEGIPAADGFAHPFGNPTHPTVQRPPIRSRLRVFQDVDRLTIEARGSRCREEFNRLLLSSPLSFTEMSGQKLPDPKQKIEGRSAIRMGMQMRSLRTLLLLPCLLLLLVSCVHTRTTKRDPWAKIEMDLTRLDADGLRGPANGKVAVSYEFCIPNTDRAKAEVKAIDPTVEFMAGSRGRIGAGPHECLCIGITHQKHHREVLHRLAELPYITRIIECHFE